VYFGATYFRGENGIQILKDFYHKIVGKSSSTTPGTETKSDTYNADDCKTELKKVQEENDELKRQLREKENQILDLKKKPK
jgi:predicted RNase H-like nuclease (RuvC/YqgF family)